jgi:hypothetical protein
MCRRLVQSVSLLVSSLGLIQGNIQLKPKYLIGSRSFYNGWKSVHGLKHQTIDCAYGMTVDLFGPYSLRRNNNKLLLESQIYNRLRNLKINQPKNDQLVIYGDSIYPRLTHVKNSFKNPIFDWQINENSKMASIRTAIEWNYGFTGNHYKYIRKLNKLKLLGESRESIYRSNYT